MLTRDFIVNAWIPGVGINDGAGLGDSVGCSAWVRSHYRLKFL